jgi:hypothetical protein
VRPHHQHHAGGFRAGQLSPAARRELRDARFRNPAVPNVQSRRAIYAVREAVQRDPGLAPEERRSLLDQLNDPSTTDTLLSGGLGLIIARWLKLSPAAQVLLSLAGLGVGRMLHNRLNDQNRSSDWNAKTRMHEIRD